MRIFTTRTDLVSHLEQVKRAGKTIGFVPTMGALHEGHLSLINIARNHCGEVVCSIFVNPTQFNNPEDLEKYPRPVEADIEKLQKSGCDVLFLPPVNEMYQPGEHWHVDLGNLENVLEGKFRPGHYQGVTQIVKKLFDLVKPDKAFFGQKDFQQFMVIRRLVEIFNIPVELVMCPIIREPDGLAMSSRNVHLSLIDRKNALALSKALFLTQKSFPDKSIEALKRDADAFLAQSEGVIPEYFEICNAENLEPVPSKEPGKIIALVAARVGATRLIDNLILK